MRAVFRGGEVRGGLAFGPSPRARLVRDLMSMTVKQLDELAVEIRSGTRGSLKEADARLVATYAEQRSHAALWREAGNPERAATHERAAAEAVASLSKEAGW
jgi:hypothetical protein